MKTRNKVNLPISFCTTGNFLNLQKIKFNPMDNPPKVKNSKHLLINLQNKNSQLNLSEYQNLKNDEIAKKDELIQKLKEKIKFLEKKIKILESNKSKNKIKSRNISFSNTLLLRTEKNSSNKNNINTNSRINKTIIPLDKQLIKSKLIKNKKNIFELIDMNKVKIIKKMKSRNNSLNNNKNDNNSHNNSLSNYASNYTAYSYTKNNSYSGSAIKSRKKSIKLNIQSGKINSLHNLLYSISANKKSKKNISKEKNCLDKKINIINTIPKKGRSIQNISTPKIMMSSTNYTNNASNSFKDEINNNNTNNNAIINTSFNELQIKLDNIKNRTKKLFEFFSSINNLDKYNNKKNSIINKDRIKKSNFPFNIKISKLEKIKK